MIYTLALQSILFNYTSDAPCILLNAGSAKSVYENRNNILDIFPDATPTLVRQLQSDWTNVMKAAEKELEWCEKKHISVLSLLSDGYPERLKTCTDAPIAIFYRGTADINSQHIISIVGTREATTYGKDSVHEIVSGLKKHFPDTIIVSGLAYGIDVCSHREALKAGMETIGVVAHGLDTIYPAANRPIARDMLQQGGVLSEYPSGTRIEKVNFLRRNRIVAGLSDAVIVVESKTRGGSLSTARIANEYNREVFAVPGRTSDATSAGCNELIAASKAIIYTGIDALTDFLGWISETQRNNSIKQGIELPLFLELSEEEKCIVDLLHRGDMQKNMLCTLSGIPSARLSALLFELEMKGVVRPLIGGVFHLVKK